MPRGRMINKRISLDQEVAKLTPESNILYVWTLPHLDSEGKIHADPQILKGVVCPYLDFMSVKVIKKCLDELNSTPLVVVYGDNCKYMKYMGFDKNQKINKDKEAESDIPNPTPEELQSKSIVSPPKDKISKDKVSATQALPPKDFLETLKNNSSYKHIDIDLELGKMDAWLSLPKNKHRKKTPSFVLNWLNRIEKSLDIKPKWRQIA